MAPPIRAMTRRTTTALRLVCSSRALSGAGGLPIRPRIPEDLRLTALAFEPGPEDHRRRTLVDRALERSTPHPRGPQLLRSFDRREPLVVQLDGDGQNGAKRL